MAYRMRGVCPCFRDENKKCQEWYLCGENESAGREATEYFLDDAPEELTSEAADEVYMMEEFGSMRRVVRTETLRSEREMEAMYVANSVRTVARGMWSAGILYDKLTEKSSVEILFVIGNAAIGEVTL